MKRYRNQTRLLLSFLLTNLLCLTLNAGPTIIRDNRIFDLATTPVLGRGYSMSTNTFQSTCMQNIEVTEPSYDFDYTFESLQKEEMERTTTTRGLGVDVSYLAFNIQASGSSTEVEGTTMYYHNIRVEINMHTYYASVDEGSTSLSDAARTLLLNDDIPGFFHSCGSYYVRSIGRTAKFVSLFTYLDESQERNKDFEMQLELAIKGFGGQLVQHLSSNTAGPRVALTVKNSFESMAQKKRLTITTKAWGLGKNKNATLIAYDLPTYKAAIREAFISMQNPMTGRVATMEVIPWVENASFQNYINLEEDVENESGERLLLFEKKSILNLNAEFLAQIGRTDRNLMDIYYKAMICKQQIDSRWKRDGKLLPGLTNAMLQNNKNTTTVKIQRLEDELTPAKIDELLMDEDKFMYGEDGKSGARQCMREIMSQGIFRKSWRDIPICRELRTRFSTSVNEIIDDYCMPKLARSRN